MQIIALKKNTNNELIITWGVLFPRNFSDELKKYMDNYSIHKYLGAESAEGFDSDEGEEMQKVLVRMLLDKEYRLRVKDGVDITNKKRSQFNKYFNNYNMNITRCIYKCCIK